MHRASIGHNLCRLGKVLAFLAATALLPAPPLLAAPGGPPSALQAAMSPGTSQSGDNFLPADEAFRFDAVAEGPDRI
ncbi:MAG TPA: hypothetical protein VFB37_16730, partial [Steroidobacteraceae bacterium]|nr:hypothetical protein [Steroidobacteraceae bacterium]